MNAIGLTSKFFNVSTPEAWAAAREAGFETAELVLPPDLSLADGIVEAGARRAHILGAGLEIRSAHLPFGDWIDVSCADRERRASAMTAQKRALAQLALWGARIAVLHASFEPISDAERAARLDIARDAIAELGEHARALGVTLAIEVLPRTCLGNCAAEMLYLTDEGRAAAVNLDFNHLLRETHREFIEATASHIVTTHVSDYDFMDEKHWAPGVGKVDWPDVVGRLIGSGYQGQLMLETYEDRAVPGTRCTPRTLMEYWKRAMGDVG